MSILSLFSCEAPLCTGDILARAERKEIPEWAAKYNLGRAETSKTVGCVALSQEGSDQGVCVQSASRAKTVLHQPLGLLDGNLGSLVGLGMVGRGDPLGDPPPLAELSEAG